MISTPKIEIRPKLKDCYFGHHESKQKSDGFRTDRTDQ